MNIPKKDLKITIARGSGKGGQAVNKTNNAVRILHLPTGIEAYSHERTQGKSRKVAMALLVKKLGDLENQKVAETKKAKHKDRVANSTRVRTYDQSANRVTDHRTGVRRTFDDVVRRGNIQDLLEGGLADL